MKMTSDEIAAKIASDAPAQDSTFAHSIVGEMAAAEYDKPWWTGWKSPMSDSSSLYVGFPRDHAAEVPEWIEGYCGQWCCLLDNPQRAVYVNVPGMESGVIQMGAFFEIGTERVSKETPVDELERIIEQGYHKLTELITAEKSRAT